MNEFFKGFMIWCFHHPIFLLTAILGVFLTIILPLIIDRPKELDKTKPTFVYFSKK